MRRPITATPAVHFATSRIGQRPQASTPTTRTEHRGGSSTSTSASRTELVWISRDPRIPVGTPQTATRRATSPKAIVDSGDISVDVGRRPHRRLRLATPLLDDADTTVRQRQPPLQVGGRQAQLHRHPPRRQRAGARLGSLGATAASRRLHARRRSRATAVASSSSRGRDDDRRTRQRPLHPDRRPADGRGDQGDRRRAAAGQPALRRHLPRRLRRRLPRLLHHRLAADPRLRRRRDATAATRPLRLRPRRRQDARPHPAPGRHQRPERRPGDRRPGPRARRRRQSPRTASTVYFVADAAYDIAPNPEGDCPRDGAPNLYMAKLGDDINDPIELRFVATLALGDSDAWQALVVGTSKAAYASPDGSALGFGSSAEPRRRASHSAARPSSTSTTPTTRRSTAPPARATARCRPATSTVSSDRSERPTAAGSTSGVRQALGQRATARVFFDTPTPLVAGRPEPADDVYEYRDGELRLISAGTRHYPSRFENASRDGSTVFFNTPDALVPQDNEPGIPKLYAARVGGGFPYTPPTPRLRRQRRRLRGRRAAPPRSPRRRQRRLPGPGQPAGRKPARRRCPKGKRKVRRGGKVRYVQAPQAPPPPPQAPPQARTTSRAAKHNRRAAR